MNDLEILNHHQLSNPTSVSAREARKSGGEGGGKVIVIVIVVLTSLIKYISSVTLDCLQSAFSLKIRLVLISSSAIANHDVNTLETRREKTDCWLFCSKKTLRLPRNGASDWSIAQMLTDHWLVCSKNASNKNSHNQLQTIANQAVISVKKLLKISSTRKLL